MIYSFAVGLLLLALAWLTPTGADRQFMILAGTIWTCTGMILHRIGKVRA